jgi:diguanylate cyclase
LSKDEERACAEAHARDALAWIAEHRITPSPESFEVAFHHVIRQHGELRRNIESVLRSGGKIDDYIVTILHQRYFRSRKVESAVAYAGEELSRELASALEMLEAASRDQATFGQELGAAAKDLAARRRDGSTDLVIGRVLEELQRMQARSNLLEEKLQSSSREVNGVREQLEAARRESLTDPLTGISNRKGFDVALQREIDASVASGEPLSLLVCDIDHFMRLSDQGGHETGDHALRAVAACLSRNVKGRDIPARLGEEFAVILPRTYLNDAVVVADHIRTDLAEKESTGVDLGPVTLSVGVAEHTIGDSSAELVRRAQACLYAAKHAGCNQVMSETDSKQLKAASAHAA